MEKMKFLMILLLILGFVAVGCAPKSPPGEVVEEPLVIEEEEEAEEEVAVVEEEEETPAVVVEEEGEEEVAPPPPAEEPSGPVMGWRVQLGAFLESSRAEARAEEARAYFTESVYVMYISPYYKVWVGDCETRECAELLRDKARRLGFVDAFIVETEINK